MAVPLKVRSPRPATPVVSAAAGPRAAAPGPVASKPVAGNAAVTAEMSGTRPGWSGRLLAGQNVVGNQAVAAAAKAGPTGRAPQRPAKPAPAKKDPKTTDDRAKAAAAPSAGVAGRPVDGVRLAGPLRLALPSFARRFDAPAALPPVRAPGAGDRDALASASRAFARLVDRARRAHEAQRSLLERLGRAAVDRHERVDGRARSRVAAAEHELDDLRLDALSTVDTAYEEGTAGLGLAVRRGRRQVASASASALRRVRANADTAGEQITTIVNDLAAGYTDLLEQSAVAITTAAGQAIAAVQAYGAAAATLFPGGATPLAEAENEARRAAVPGLADAAVKALGDASKTQSDAYRGQIKTVRDQFDASELATALRARKAEIDTKGRAAVRKATSTAYGALGKQARSGHEALRRMAGEARESIAVRHQAARDRLVNDANALLHGSHAQAAAELTGLGTAATTGLAAFGQVITSVRDGLKPAAENGAESLRRTTEKAVGDTGPKVDQLGVAQQRLVTRADASTGAVVNEVERTATTASGRARAESVAALRGTGRAAAQGIAGFVGGHDASFAATARGIRQVADAWAMPLKQVFGAAVRKTKAAMTAPFTEWKTTTDAGRDKYVGEIFTPYLHPAVKLAGDIEAAAAGVASDLEKREFALVDAFDGWGTDEAKVSKSLRGLTPTQARALRWLYESAHGSLDAALTDELSGDELESARAYLRGDQAAGAAAELRASTHWYNDDEARIEELMRNLKPEELEKLKGSKEGADALAEVRDSLGGTDLKVFDALAAGNQNLADAFRMKDRIDDARRAGDLDALHDTLIEYGKAPAERGRAQATADERRVAVQQELAGIIAGTGKVAPQQAAAAVEKYALAPIQVTVTDAEGGSTVETREVTGANRDLAVALIRGGENTVAARAARLGVETQRPGGPNLLKLDAALVDPRLKPGAKVPEQDRKAALDERNQVFRKYAADYGGAAQAGTPASARNYLEGQLKTAYGDDKDAAELAVRLAHEDYPTPKTAALALKYASKGAGTDEELMFRFVERMDRDEIAAMRVEYRSLTGTALDDDLGTFGGQGWFTELSGDERLRMERALLGVPRNDRERAEVAAFTMQQQRDETGWLGSWLAGDSMADRDLALAQSRLTTSLGGATVRVDDKGNPVWTDAAGRPIAAGGGLFDEDGKYTGADPREFASAVRVSKLAAENYAAAIDRYASVLTTAVMVVGAIAAAVATVATGGAASPLLIAAIAGLTGLGSMAVHSAVSGGRYGWEQAAVDLGMTAVQALTAGIGQHLSIVARGGAQSLAAGMTTLRSAEGLAPTMGGITGSTLGDLLVIGGATGGLGGFGGALLDEATWRKGFGPGFAALLEATLTGALAGMASTVTSQAFESLPAGRATTLGDALSGSLAARTALRGTSSFLGGATGKGVELGIGAATGKLPGDAGDILQEMGKAGLESAVQESAAGPLEKPARFRGPAESVEVARRAARSTRTDTGDVAPGAVANLLRKLPSLPDDSPASIRALVATVVDGDVVLEPVGGHDGRARTTRPVYRVTVDGEPAGYVKIVPDGAEFAQELSAADRLGQAELTAFGVPDVLAVASVPGPEGTRRGALFTAAAPGVSVDALLRRVPLAWDRDRAMDDLRRAVTGVAEGMAELHRGGDRQASPAYLAPHAAAIREHLAELAARRPLLEELGVDIDGIQAALETTLARAAADPGPAALVHGDAHLGNFLWDADAGVSMIDAPTLHQSMNAAGDPIGSPARDVSLFTQRIGHFGREFGLTPQDIGLLRQDFADAYARGGGPVVPAPVQAMFDARAAAHRLARAMTRLEERPDPRRAPDVGAATAALQDALGLDSSTANRLAERFAGQLPGTPDYRRTWTAIDNFRAYMLRTADPAVRARFETEYGGKIRALQSEQAEKFKALWDDLFPHQRDEFTLSPERRRAAGEEVRGLAAEARELMDRLAEFAATTGDPALAEGTVARTVDLKGTEAWEASFREARAKIDDVVAGFTYHGQEIGYIGSMKSGLRGPHKGRTRFDPYDFDVDLYVVVDRETFAAVAAEHPDLLDTEGTKIMPDGGEPEDLVRLGKRIGAALKEKFPHVKGIEDSTIALRAEQPW
ncbi:phosphotransferase [Amycolatopsis sp. MEPSY49]|uniref:phosphotransferase n=1 Tax=Amycolatopsis sp. MEPSY49 TaxID=3151600 RepID=UPI003EF665DB